MTFNRDQSNVQPFVIKPAVRKGIPALISLWGPSFSGKTFTALQLARGLVGPEGKIGFIDSENRRAEFYSDQVDGWDHLDLQPPFTPQRYTQALKAFEDDGGYGCVIIDSMSHIWEGEGGVLQMADESKKANGKPMQGLGKWKQAKTEHKKTVNYLLRAPFHVICCFRAKDLSKQVGFGENAQIVSLGLTPICGDKLIHEFTFSALLGPDHKPVFPGKNMPYQVDPMVPILKDPLGGAIIPGEFLSIETGKAIADWVSGGVAHNLDEDRIKAEARDVATMGMERLEQHWKTLDKPARKILLPLMDELKQIAQEFDSRAQDNEEEPENPFSNPDDNNPLAESVAAQ